MYCSKCGKEGGPGPMCQNCGAPLASRQSGYPGVQTKKPGGNASMVLGIISIVTCWFPLASIIMGIVGLVLGIVGKVKGAGGKAVAGIVMSACAIPLSIIMAAIGLTV